LLPIRKLKKIMKKLFAILAIASVMTACNNHSESDTAAAVADSTRIADSTRTADSLKAATMTTTTTTTTTTVDSIKKVDSSMNNVKAMPSDTINKGVNKVKENETGK
jgi:hypothetical protein